jgi:acetyl-CoA carboxylase carboxyl transferase subunit alpha
VPEPPGGAHRDWDATASSLRNALAEQIRELRTKSSEGLVRERYEKFRRIGVFEEESLPR